MEFTLFVCHSHFHPMDVDNLYFIIVIKEIITIYFIITTVTAIVIIVVEMNIKGEVNSYQFILVRYLDSELIVFLIYCPI